MTTITNLRDDLATLTSEIEKQNAAKGSDGALAFIPSFISSAQLALTDISSGLEQLLIDDQSAEAISLRDVSNQINDFIEGFRGVYAGSIDAQLPAWMSWTRDVSLADFYREFFAQVQALPSATLERINSVLLVSTDAGQEIYAKYANSLSDTGASAEISRRRSLAYTMRHIAEEVLDLYGYTHEDVVRLLAAAPTVEAAPATAPAIDPAVVA